MFSRLFKSAKSYIAPQSEKSTSPEGETSFEQTMVTPKTEYIKNSAEEEPTKDNFVDAYVPTSSAKSFKRRAKDEAMSDDDELVTPTSKKRKVLPVRRKNTKSPKRGNDTRPVVEIPASQTTPELDFVEEEEEVVEAGAEQRKLPVTTPSKHHRFSSEEPAQELFFTAKEGTSPVKRKYDNILVIPSSDDEEDSNDDEAPEAIGIQEAAKTVKSKQNEAAQAVKQQLSAIRKKRKERDNNLKRQSEDKRSKVIADGGPENSIGDNKGGLSEVAEITASSDANSMDVDEQTRNRKRTGLDFPRGGLPYLLPAEYLEDAEPTALVLHKDLPSKKLAKPKKTKFHNLVEKAPKDKRIGSTTYRVTKVRSISLAPKSSYQARSTKESWLQGRSGKAASTERKPFSKGFFKK